MKYLFILSGTRMFAVRWVIDFLQIQIWKFSSHLAWIKVVTVGTGVHSEGRGRDLYTNIFVGVMPHLETNKWSRFSS